MLPGLLVEPNNILCDSTIKQLISPSFGIMFCVGNNEQVCIREAVPIATCP